MTSLCDASRSTLLIIDLQERLMPVIHDGATVLNNAAKLVQAAQLLDIPVIGTVQNPTRLGQNAPALHAACSTVIQKMAFDACAEPAFLAALNPSRDDLIVIGCEAHVCVLQTVLGLLHRHQRVRLVADATGSRLPLNKTFALERAKTAGAELVTTEMVLFEWMRSATHPKFKEILRLLK